MVRMIARALSIAFIAVAALSCEGTVDVLIDDVARTIAITLDGDMLVGDTVYLEVGQTLQLSADALNQFGGAVGNVSIAWGSSDPSVANIGGDVVVTALSEGFTELSASAEGLPDAVLPVVVSEATPSSLSVTPGSVVLVGMGSTRQLDVTATDSDGNFIPDPEVTWESLDPSVATVSSGGLVTAQGVGLALLVVTSACCDSNEVPVSVSPVVPPPEGVFFSSDWGTATGNSDEAISDGGTWNNMYCSGRNTTLTVVPGNSVGFSQTANVLRVQELGDTCGMLEAIDAIPLSTSHYGRMYFRNDETQSRTNHTMTYFPVGRIQAAVWNRSGSPTGVNIRMRFYYNASGGGASYPHHHFLLGDSNGQIELSNGVWYRYEWHKEYLTPTTYRVWPRIYTVDGTTPLYDADDFWGGDNTVRLSDHYANGGAFGFLDVELARNFGIGNEGPVSASGSGEYWYHAGVALSAAGWIGR